MKKPFLLLAIFIIFFGAFFLSRRQAQSPRLPSPKTSPTETSSGQIEKNKEPKITVVAEGLDTPWGLVFLPDGSLLLTERLGRVRLIDTNGTLNPKPVATLNSVKEIGEGGLLGIDIHPDFAANKFVYVYYTYTNSGENTKNRVARLTYENGTLNNETIILDNIPGASNHNGGRIKFGPDGFLYIGTGDAQEPSEAQNTDSLAGKILRVTDSGAPAPGNPYGNPVYSYGHRNVQGLAWISDGALWATEHGRSGIQSGLDELNRIEPGKNYGWPTIEGTKSQTGMEAPQKNSGSVTWAPSGLTYMNGSLYFGGLRGQSLYEAKLIGSGAVSDIQSHLNTEYGRLRDVVTGPDGLLYVTTSNKDGRGSPSNTDDRVLKINPTLL